MGWSEPNPDWHAFVQAPEGSEVEGVFLPGFGNLGLERARDVCSDERVASAEDFVGGELCLY